MRAVTGSWFDTEDGSITAGPDAFALTRRVEGWDGFESSTLMVGQFQRIVWIRGN